MNWFVRMFPKWRELVSALVFTGVILAILLKSSSAAIWGVIIFSSPLFAAVFFAEFMHWHRGRSQPDEGRIAAIQSVIGLLMIWIPFIFVDNNAYEILTLKWDSNSLETSKVLWPLNLLLAPQEDSVTIWHSNLQSLAEASQGIWLSRLIARTVVFFIPSLWTMMIFEHFLLRTCQTTRGNRLVALMGVGTFLHFGLAWRWIPNEVMFGSDFDLTWKWFLGCLVVCYVIAPITPDSGFRPEPI